MTSTLFNTSTRFPIDSPISALQVSMRFDEPAGPTEDSTKRCTKCGKTKDRSEFNKNRARKDGLSDHCKECCKECNAAYSKSEAGKATMRRRKLKFKYGLTEESFQAILDSQNGRCACCGIETPSGRGNWHVDHCHETGKVRGLLCYNCNTGAGKFGDNLNGALLHVDYMIRTCSTTEEMTPELETKLAAVSLELQLLLAGVGQ